MTKNEIAILAKKYGIALERQPDGSIGAPKNIIDFAGYVFSAGQASGESKSRVYAWKESLTRTGESRYLVFEVDDIKNSGTENEFDRLWNIVNSYRMHRAKKHPLNCLVVEAAPNEQSGSLQKDDV